MKAVMAADQAISGQCIRGTTNWAAAIGKAVQDAVMVAVEGPPGSGGWKSHAEAMERERDYWRQRAKLMSEHQDGVCWYWQGDGSDYNESLVNSLPVVIRADQLRELLAAASQKADGAIALVTQHALTRDGILGKEGQVVTAHWPVLPDLPTTTQAESQPAPEYVGNGMFKGETIEKAAENWANWCDVRCMTGLSEFLRVIAARAAAVDERDNFEKVFPLPSGCIRVGAGYASTGYSNWAAHTHRERWEGWNARAIHGPDGSLQIERERICAAIKAEDDHCVDNGDYMLDSDDCIKIVRGEWVRPDFSIDGARKGCKQ